MATKQPANAATKPGASPGPAAVGGKPAPGNTAAGGKSPAPATNPASQSNLPDKSEEEDAPPMQHDQMSPEQQKEHEKRIKDVSQPSDTKAARFKKYLSKTGLPLVFQVIYGEIITQGIDEDNVFGYTAMRLRQIGNEIVQIVRHVTHFRKPRKQRRWPVPQETIRKDNLVHHQVEEEEL